MSENQRVRLTKKLLMDSLIQLLKEKNIYKISIKEICENAEVNRSTFYKHYSTEFDLLKELENNYLNQIEEYIDSGEQKYIFERLLEYVIENIEVFNLFLNDTPGNEFYERIITMAFEKISYDQRVSKKISSDKPEYLHYFILFGALAIVKKWISKTPRETPKQMNKILLEIMDGYFI